MSNAYFAVATDSQFDPVFKARDGATVKTIDRSTFSNFNHCSRQVKSAAYTTVVRPVLQYASAVWNHYHQADIKTLEQVQEQVLFPFSFSPIFKH